MGKFKITDEQFDQIKHLNKNLMYINDQIYSLCNGEKSDIEYGFTLGQIHSLLSTERVNILLLEEAIQNQNK